MGYELECLPSANDLDRDDDVRYRALERRWRIANERLAAALTGYHALRGRTERDDPDFIVAQLRLAQARQRCREVADEVELLAHDSRLYELS
jgi:hypothetical protein